ncbi:MAG: MG2 domain-containing protein [Acidobacteriota bacterium]
MGTKRWWALAAAALWLFTQVWAEEGLRVLKAGPIGETASLGQAAEIRVVFSEPMVALGRVAELREVQGFSISPPVAGTFRWAGTDTLVFRPEATLPFATRYEVKIGPQLRSAAGRSLPTPYAFSFTTPTVRLRSVRWAREDGTVRSPVLLAVAFNQKVDPRQVLPHLSLAYRPHPYTPPPLPAGAQDRLSREDPRAVEDYQFKAAAASLAAKSSGAVPFEPAASWDEKKFPRSDEVLVLRTRSVPPPNAWMELVLDGEAPSLDGAEVSGEVQRYTVQLEPAFFVTGFRCTHRCVPDGYNPLEFTGEVRFGELKGALSVLPEDGGGPSLPKEPAEGEEGSWDWPSRYWSLDRLGLEPPAAASFFVKVDRNLKADDGQVLGYTWLCPMTTSHRTAFSAFESGFGVWEASGGPILPFSVRNLTSVNLWVMPLKLGELLPAVQKLAVRPVFKDADTGEKEADWNWRPFSLPPPVAPLRRPLKTPTDRVAFVGLDLSSTLNDKGRGLSWVAVEDGPPIPGSAFSGDPGVKASLVQVTDLGLTVKDSPQGILVWVTRLSDGTPVAGAAVAVWKLDGTQVFEGTTGPDGTVLTPPLSLRDPEEWWDLAFVVSAEKDGDTAYLCSDWNEGLEPWAFGVDYDLREQKPLLRGRVFPDRGVYKLGEEVHLKAVLRSDTAAGMKVPPEGTEVSLRVEDSRGGKVDQRTVKLDAFGAADLVVKVPEEAPLGTYTVSAEVEGHLRGVSDSFLVAAYKKPDFRVDANLGAERPVAGASLLGTVTGRYLFGAPMAGRPCRFSVTRRRLLAVPAAVAERYPGEWVFAEDIPRWEARGEETVKEGEGPLDARGTLRVEVPTTPQEGRSYTYTLEGTVTDVSRQTLSGRTSFPVYAAPFFAGIKAPPFFVDAGKDLVTEVLAPDLQGNPVEALTVSLKLVQVQWHAVRRAEGNGFYTWETERKEVERWTGKVSSAARPVEVPIPVAQGGYYLLSAEASDGQGRTARSQVSFYALGAGFTAWERYDHNRIDLVPERKSYRPGETARILIKSPWEKAKALLTVEREGIRTHRVFDLVSTQQTVEVPVGEGDVPNVFVSVVLLKGRTEAYTGEDASDPGKPAFRMGLTEIKVENSAKRLSVAVSTDAEEYRPGAQATVSAVVTDGTGKAAEAQVTLWAVDHGVLSLTGYATPDLLPSVWVDKALQVLAEDSRQRIVSRRVLTPKGGDEGGGGGAEEGPGDIRKDFRVLAFYLGSLVTDGRWKVTTKVTLPEGLTTYRVMAVAHDKASRFGFGQKEIRTSKPLLLLPSMPRFLAKGDRALFGVVVHNRSAEAGKVRVEAESLDGGRLALAGPAVREVDTAPGAPVEVRFPFEARGVGAARLRFRATLGGESDAFEQALPVEVLVSSEAAVATGSTGDQREEFLQVPGGIVPGAGGLETSLSSTALTGLEEGARYLVDYPYGCAEQRGSATLALVLVSDLSGAFSLPGIETAKVRETAQRNLKALEAFQCENGGFVYWKGESCLFASEYLTAYLLHVYQRAEALGFTVNGEVLRKGYEFLERGLNRPSPVNEGWWPAYTAWQAYAVKVLADGGRTVDSHLVRLYAYTSRMPVFGLAYLEGAMARTGRFLPERADLLRRMDNAILPEGAAAHVEELSDPYLLWFWNSNVRSTAIVLSAFTKDPERRHTAERMVRWLLDARRKGRWGNTQENAHCMEALIDYYRAYESEVPDFRAVVSLAGKTLMEGRFEGRSTEAKRKALPMEALQAQAPAGTSLPLVFSKKGTGRLFYTARLRYALDPEGLGALDQGIAVERRYELYAENGGGAPARAFPLGRLVRVTLTLTLPKERRYVAVTDPLPAGLEPVESWFATTARDLQKAPPPPAQGGGDEGNLEDDLDDDGWFALWQRGGFDHVERHDDRVLLFARRLAAGRHVFSYVARATTQGAFVVAPAYAEEMYSPEVFGRTATEVLEVRGEEGGTGGGEARDSGEGKKAKDAG